MMWLNVGCGTHRAPAPWLNTDIVESDSTNPDLVVTPEDPFPFPAETVQRAMLGHVMEHVPLADMPGFLSELFYVLEPGAEILVVGPDVYRTIKLWAEKREPWFLVESVLEHAAYPGTTDWPGALHHWNCHEERVVEMLGLAGFDQVKALASPPDGWPVVGWAEWQCCVSAVRR